MEFIEEDQVFHLLHWFITVESDVALYVYIKRFYQPLNAVDFGRLILDLQRDLEHSNFEWLENLFSDMMWKKAPVFMQEVHQFSENNSN